MGRRFSNYWMDDFGNIVPYQGQDLGQNLSPYDRPQPTTDEAGARYAAQIVQGPPNPVNIPIGPSGNYALPGTGNLQPRPVAQPQTTIADTNMNPSLAAVLQEPPSPSATPAVQPQQIVADTGTMLAPQRQMTLDIPPNPKAGEGIFQFRLKGPDGTWKFSRDIGEIDTLIGKGYKVIHDDGSEARIEQFNGGTLLDGLPLNAPLTGSITEDQRTALINGGRWLPEWDSSLKVVSGTAGSGKAPGLDSSTGNTTPSGPPAPPTSPRDTGYLGNQGAGAPGLPEDFKKMLMDLMQRSLDQGAKGQEAFTGVMDDLKNYLAFSRAGAEQTYNKRDALTTDLLGRLTPSIDAALANMNNREGLSPEAMSALRLNALESPEYAYQGQAQQLKSMLGSRGAYGGETPGSMGDIVRGYGPLLAARDATRSNLLANTILADEQRKFDTLGLNRQTGLGALGAGGGLLSTVGNIYNPSPFLGANESALSGLLGATQGYNAAGFQGLAGAAPFANVYGDTQTGSFSSLLKSALAGTLTSAATQLPWDKIIKSIGGLFGGGNNNQVVTSTTGPIGGWGNGSSPFRGWDPDAWE